MVPGGGRYASLLDLQPKAAQMLSPQARSASRLNLPQHASGETFPPSEPIVAESIVLPPAAPVEWAPGERKANQVDVGMQTDWTGTLAGPKDTVLLRRIEEAKAESIVAERATFKARTIEGDATILFRMHCTGDLADLGGNELQHAWAEAERATSEAAVLRAERTYWQHEARTNAEQLLKANTSLATNQQYLTTIRSNANAALERLDLTSDFIEKQREEVRGAASRLPRCDLELCGGVARGEGACSGTGRGCRGNGTERGCESNDTGGVGVRWHGGGWGREWHGEGLEELRGVGVAGRCGWSGVGREEPREWRGEVWPGEVWVE